MKFSKYILLLVMITIAFAANPGILTGNSKAAQETRFCEGSLAQKLGSLECAAVLRICIEGVVYKTAGMDKPRLIRWQDVAQHGSTSGRDGQKTMRVHTNTCPCRSGSGEG